MRLFIAIFLPGTVRRHLQQTADSLRPLSSDVRWIPRENLHLTLKFLGQTDEPLVPKICDALQQIKIEDSIELQANGLQCFPPHGPLRIVAAALSDSDSRCAALVGEIESICENFGFARESRRYTPHITLGRVKQSSPDLRQTLATAAAEEFPGPAFNCDEFTLMESRLNSAGPSYLKLASFPLFSS